MKNHPKSAKGIIKRLQSCRPDTMEHYSLEETEEFCNPVHYSAIEHWFSNLDTSMLQGPKVIFNNSGYYFKKENPDKYMWLDDKGIALGNAFQLKFETMEIAKNAIQVFRSCLYVFFVEHMKTGGFNAGALYLLPLLDFSRSWSDEELYNYFGLTQEEIYLIESTVK